MNETKTKNSRSEYQLRWRANFLARMTPEQLADYRFKINKKAEEARIKKGRYVKLTQDQKRLKRTEYRKKIMLDGWVRCYENMRCRLKQFNDTARIKGAPFSCYLGLTKEQLKQKFEDDPNGMNWANYGQWHVDHIVPLASFDLTKIEEVKKAFHHTNIRRMWGAQNSAKGARVTHRLLNDIEFLEKVLNNLGYEIRKKSNN